MSSIIDAFSAPGPDGPQHSPRKKKYADGWEPRLELDETDGGFLVSKPSEENKSHAEIFDEYALSMDDWIIDKVRKNRRQLVSGKWVESHFISFLPKGGPSKYELPDLHDIEKSIAERKKVKIPKVSSGKETTSVVGVLADLQIGKTGSRGGVEELMYRLDLSLDKWIDYVKKVKPAEIVLVDAGDIIEGFENTAAQARTNDLSFTQQLQVARRVEWKWIDAASQLAPSVTVLGVSSNHTRVRSGKAYLSNPSDDFGLDILSQLEDQAKINTDKYGHIKFKIPTEFSESLAHTLLGEKILGLVHGHQVSKPESLPQWWAGQSHGRTPVGMADILIAGHFHNLRVQTSGNDRWLFIAPTSDNGSDWFNNLSGHESAAGVLTFTVNEAGWSGLAIC